MKKKKEFSFWDFILFLFLFFFVVVGCWVNVFVDLNRAKMLMSSKFYDKNGTCFSHMAFSKTSNSYCTTTSQRVIQSNTRINFKEPTNLIIFLIM